jgi:HEAT repeat protein
MDDKPEKTNASARFIKLNRCGRLLYEDKIQALVEPRYNHLYIALHVEEEQFAVASSPRRAVYNLLQDFPDKDRVYLRKIGEETEYDVSAIVSQEEETATASEINALISQLDESSHRFFVAANDLIQIGAPAVEALCHALNSDKEQHRRKILVVLMKIGNRGAVSSLYTTLQDQSAHIRMFSAIALGSVDDARVADALLAALQDRSSIVRAAAAESLGKLQNENALLSLRSALTDSNWYVRRSAATALGEIGVPAALEPLLAALCDDVCFQTWLDTTESVDCWPVRDGVEEALLKIGAHPAVNSLLLLLQHAEGDVRRRAITLLSHTREGCIVEPLCKALDDADNSVRAEAAGALGRMGDVRAVEALCRALKDEDFYVQSEAAKALDTLGDARTLPRKILAAAGLSLPQRLSALQTLRQVRYRAIGRNLHYALPDLSKFCRQALKDTDSAVQNEAKEMLHYLELLRTTSQGASQEAQELLRVPAGIPTEEPPDELLRATKVEPSLPKRPWWRIWK